MTGLSISPTATYGVVACALAVLIAAYLVLSPGPLRLPVSRRRPLRTRIVSPLAQATGRATALIDKLLRRTNKGVHVAVLERAGVTMRLQDLSCCWWPGPWWPRRRESPLAESSRACYSRFWSRSWPGSSSASWPAVAEGRSPTSSTTPSSSSPAACAPATACVQALASVAREAEEPTSMEFARIMNETRVGRPLRSSLDETAARMESDDFTWVTQAIAINREAGGNLAEVLDGVGNTIRERNQIRRQVKALSAEGKLSAYVLMALPFGIAGFLAFANPKYLAKFTESLLGYVPHRHRRPALGRRGPLAPQGRQLQVLTSQTPLLKGRTRCHHKYFSPSPRRAFRCRCWPGPSWRAPTGSTGRRWRTCNADCR